MLSFTPQPAPTIQTRTVLSNKVLVLESVVLDVSCIKRTHLCVCGLIQWKTQTKSTTTANDQYLDSTTLWNRSCWSGVPCRDKPNVNCCQENNQVRGHFGVVWRLQSNWNIPECVEEVWTQVPCKEFLSVGTGWCRTASKLRRSEMTERCSRVRLCEPVTQCSLCSAVARSQRLRQSSKILAEG